MFPTRPRSYIVQVALRIIVTVLRLNLVHATNYRQVHWYNFIPQQHVYAWNFSIKILDCIIRYLEKKYL